MIDNAHRFLVPEEAEVILDLTLTNAEAGEKIGQTAGYVYRRRKKIGVIAANARKGNKGRPIIDLTGQRFGQLTAVAMAPKELWKRDTAHWECLCECGNFVIVRRDSLMRNPPQPQSCGCLRYEMVIQAETVVDFEGRQRMWPTLHALATS